MKIIDNRNIKKLKTNDLVDLKCKCCNNTFKKKATEVRSVLNNPNNGKNTLDFCSLKCSSTGKYNSNYKNGTSFGTINTKCDWCERDVIKRKIEFDNNEKHFCDKSCSAKYGNTYRRYGIAQRSKLEIYIEKRFSEEYKDISITYNSREILNGLELDIYFPNKKLAIEINGPGHYIPIYGEKSLKNVKRNDKIKKKLCKKSGILLVSIKTKPDKSTKYYEKIKEKL